MSAESPRGGLVLLPPVIRRPAGLAMTCCALVAVVLAAKFHDAVTYGRVDAWIQFRVPVRESLPVTALSDLADLSALLCFVLTGVVAAVMLAVRNWRFAGLAVLGPGLTMLTVETGKFAVGRLYDGVPSLPSGHTAAITSVAVVIVLLLIGRMREHVLLAATAGAVLVTLVSAAMAALLVLLRWHYATDTVAGYSVAIATTLAVAFALDATGRRRVRHVGAHRSPAAHRLAQPLP